MFLGWMNKCCGNDNTIPCDLQTQCNSYQINNDSFHRTRTKYFTIHIETQKAMTSQSNFSREEWSWRNQVSLFQTILQSYSHQDSMVLAQKQKYRPEEQDRIPGDRPMHLQTTYL